jgi:hypothetical protein
MPNAGSKPGKAQTIFSLIILAAILGIGIGVYIKQFRINPAVIALRPTQLDSQVFEHPSNNKTIKTPFPFPKGVNALSPLEVFDHNTLSDKINGKADFYLSAGFIQLKSQRITLGTNSNLWAEMFVYNMGSEEKAYAVFSAQKRHDSSPSNITRFSYATKNALFFINGPFYIEIIASKGTKKSVDAISEIAKDYISKNQTNNKSIPELSLFPMNNLRKDSIVLHTSDVFGCESLDQVFSAVYNFSDIEVTGFLSRRNTTQEAKQIAVKFHDFLIKFGGKDVDYSGSVQGVRMVDMFGSFEVIFSRGQFFAGVHEAENRELAEKLIKSLDQKLAEVINGQ